MSAPAIRIDGLAKRYALGTRARGYRTFRDALAGAATAPLRRLKGQGQAHIWALKDLSLDVPRGEVIGIIGANGAGKSTLLKILSRVTAPTAGRVEIRGRVASLLEVGTGFHPELTGRENIFLNGTIFGMRRHEIRRKLDAIVAFAGVEPFLETPVKRYSSGMRVRLAFAVAAHLEPEIMIMDEVLAVGDAEFQRKCLGKLDDVARREGRTVLFVSHNMAAVRRLCRSAALLERGRLSRAGPVDAVIEAYLSGRQGAEERRFPAEQGARDAGLGILGIDARRVGDALALELDLSLSEELAAAVPRLGIGLVLRGRDGGVISQLKPLKTGLAIETAAGRRTVSLLVPDFFLLLTEGSYSFDLRFTDPGVEIIARADHAVGIEVPMNDRYGSGHSLTQAEDGPLALEVCLEEGRR